MTPPSSARATTRRRVGDPDGDGVEEPGRLHGQPHGLGEGRDLGCLPVRVPGDLPQPVRAVPHRVHPGHDREQHLGGADVGRRLLAADVLLAGLQGQAQRRAAGGVLAHPDQAPGQQALQAVAHGHVAGVGAAVAHGHAEALHGADHDVGALLAGRGEQGERERVGGDGHPAAGLDDGRRHRAQVADLARGPRVLQQGTEDGAPGQRGADELPAGGVLVAVRVPLDQGARAEVEVDELDAERLGPGLQDGPGLRQHVGVDEEHRVVAGLGRPAEQGHGLRGRGGLVEQARVGDVETGEVGDEGLEGEQRLEPALADLGLVRRVGGVPGRVLEHVAPDHGRGDRAVVAQADHRLHDGVAGGDAPQGGERVLLVEGRREVERLALPDPRGDGGVDQGGEALVAGGARVGAGVRDVAQVAVDERCAGSRARQALLGLLGAGLGAGLHAAPRGRPRAHGRARRVGPRQSGASPPACLFPAVRVPERFRGSCPFGAASRALPQGVCSAPRVTAASRVGRVRCGP